MKENVQRNFPGNGGRASVSDTQHESSNPPFLVATLLASGACADAGRIDVSLNTDGSLAWAWFVIDANTARVTATLNPVGACSVTQSRTK